MLRVHWTEVQRAELEVLRDRGQPAYLRERAAALLKVAGGNSATQVARQLLLRPHNPYIVRQWVRSYQQEGVQGLRHKPRGGGRPPGAKDRTRRKWRAIHPP
jgi:transposase